MFSNFNLPARRSRPRRKMDENDEMFNLNFNVNGEVISCSFPIDSTDHLFKITSKFLIKQEYYIHVIYLNRHSTTAILI